MTNRSEAALKKIKELEADGYKVSAFFQWAGITHMSRHTVTLGLYNVVHHYSTVVIQADGSFKEEGYSK